MFIKGIDLAAGLESVNQDEAIYDEILKIYYDDGVAMLDLLKQNLQHTDLKLFIIHTHAMKSASKGIGANDVSERFKEMEFAGKDEDMEKIEADFPSCLAAFEELLGNIREYFDKNSSEKKDNAFTDRLNAMKSVLEDMDTDSFEEQLIQLEGECVDYEKTKLEEIRSAYEECDYAKVISLIEALQ